MTRSSRKEIIMGTCKTKAIRTDLVIVQYIQYIQEYSGIFRHSRRYWIEGTIAIGGGRRDFKISINLIGGGLKLLVAWKINRKMVIGSSTEKKKISCFWRSLVLSLHLEYHKRATRFLIFQKYSPHRGPRFLQTFLVDYFGEWRFVSGQFFLHLKGLLTFLRDEP